MVDVEERQFLVADLVQRLEQLLADLLAGLGVDFAGLRIDEILGEIHADEVLIGHAQRLEALFLQLAGGAHGQLLAGLEHHLAAVGVDQVARGGVAAETVGRERHAPAVLGALVLDLLVEDGEDFLAIETQRIHQRRHRNLAATVDAREHDVLGVELDVEPGAAIRNDAGGEQQLARRMGLALVVVEEHARRTVHLRDDDALGAVDDEGAVHGHERDVAHVDILLLDVLHRLGAGFLVDIEHDEAQRHLERRSEGHAALTALVDVVLRRLELVAHEFELRGAGEVVDREHGAEHRLQTFVQPPARRFVHHQELVIGCLLNLDQVRHLGDFPDVSEKLANAFATGERLLRHRGLSFCRQWLAASSGIRWRTVSGLNFPDRLRFQTPQSAPLSQDAK